MFTLVDKYWGYNKNVANFLLIMVIIISGISVTQANLKNPTYSFYEVWSFFILDSQFAGILMFQKLINAVISLYIILAIYVFMLHWYYENVSFVLYISLFNIVIFFPIICIFISQKFKEMIQWFIKYFFNKLKL